MNSTPMSIAVTSAIISAVALLINTLLESWLKRRSHTDKKEGLFLTWLADKLGSSLWFSKWRTTISLLLLWWGLVVLLVVVLQSFAEGRTVLGYRLHFDIARIAVVIGIAIIDLLVRWVVFRRIQSISLDILIFAFVHRLVTILSGLPVGANPQICKLELFTLMMLVVLLFAGGSAYWLYKDAYTKRFKNWFCNGLRSLSAKLDETTRDAFAELAVDYKHIDIWGIFQQDEMSNLRNAVNGIPGQGQQLVEHEPEGEHPPRQPFEDGDEFVFPRIYRFAIVIALSALPVLAVYLNALTA